MTQLRAQLISVSLNGAEILGVKRRLDSAWIHLTHHSLAG